MSDQTPRIVEHHLSLMGDLVITAAGCDRRHRDSVRGSGLVAGGAVFHNPYRDGGKLTIFVNPYIVHHEGGIAAVLSHVGNILSPVAILTPNLEHSVTQILEVA
jgi:hypothetical protein